MTRLIERNTTIPEVAGVFAYSDSKPAVTVGV